MLLCKSKKHSADFCEGQKHEINEQGLLNIPYPKHMRKMCLPNKFIPNIDIKTTILISNTTLFISVI